MKNYVQRGDVVSVTAPSAVTSGDPVAVGDLFGIASHDAANGAALELAVVGVFKIARAGASTIGATAYFDAGAGKVTADDNTGANARVGHFLAAGTDGACPVRLAP